jgi:hypothetical protein
MGRLMFGRGCSAPRKLSKLHVVYHQLASQLSAIVFYTTRLYSSKRDPREQFHNKLRDRICALEAQERVTTRYSPRYID